MFPDKIYKPKIEIEIVPRYNETDQGGIVHHCTYPVYFEIARTELLRANGMAYAELEKNDCRMVVAELNVKYRTPAFYDEKLAMEVECTKVTRARIEHSYRLYRAQTNQTVCEGNTILACIDETGRPRKVPAFLYVDEG